jgi:hypothetical protein
MEKSYISFEDYKIIRDTRVAMLCVGDPIYQIHPVSGFNPDNAHRKIYDVITRTVITERLDNFIRTKLNSSGSYGNVFGLDTIEMYMDELYIWDYRYHTHSIEKIQEMIKLIEAGETVILDYTQTSAT